ATLLAVKSVVRAPSAAELASALPVCPPIAAIHDATASCHCSYRPQSLKIQLLALARWRHPGREHLSTLGRSVGGETSVVGIPSPRLVPMRSRYSDAVVVRRCGGTLHATRSERPPR